MLDIGSATRQGYFDVLNGAITYDGSVVPVVDEKLDVNISEHDIYIVLKEQTEDPNANAVKTYWSSEVVITMEVVNQRKATNTKEVVEAVSNSITTLLFPTRTTTAITLPSPFLLTYAKPDGAQYNGFIQNDLGFLIVKQLRFKNRITQ